MTLNGPAAGPLPDDAIVDAVGRHGGRLDEHEGHTRWWITDPDSAAEDTAAHLGLVERRRLYRMRRPLPLESRTDRATDSATDIETVGATGFPTIVTRAFDPERDTDTWLAINNAAFAWHPDQGGWTRETLEARMAEPWFDLDDFRVGDLDGSMAGFCWTKVHPLGVGEIYVIAVAPALAGQGLGTAFTVAGLEWLWEQHHTSTAMLYVEAGNDRALATYRRLGFTIDSTDVAFDAP